jgi:acyl-CoA synthetase (AMP-forming)/AMP-acid ligase II
VIVVESIPRSGTGKYLKSVLRERFRQHLATTQSGAALNQDT